MTLEDSLLLRELSIRATEVKGDSPYSVAFQSIIDGTLPLSEVRNTVEAAYYQVDNEPDYSDRTLYSFLMVCVQMDDKTNLVKFDTASLRYLIWKTQMLHHIHTHRHPLDLYEA